MICRVEVRVDGVMICRVDGCASARSSPMYQGARLFCSGPPCLYKEELNRASVYRVIAYFTVTGRHRAQIVYFFRIQIGSRTPSGLGLTLGSRLERVRRILVLPESSGLKTLANHGSERWSAKDLAYMYAPMGAPAHATHAIAHVYYRP